MADAEAQSTHILEYVQQHGCVEDSGVLAEQMGLEHQVVVGYIKSLEASELIVTEVLIFRLQIVGFSLSTVVPKGLRPKRLSVRRCSGNPSQPARLDA